MGLNAPYFDHAGATLHVGDCRSVLTQLPDESVQTVVTSPPYWGLRDYGTATWEGGDPACTHKLRPNAHLHVASSTLTGVSTVIPGHQQEGYRGDCRRCGAQRIDAQIGLEPSPQQYVAELVAIFREVRRVLRRDGTLWLVLGDAYAGGGQGAQRNTGQRAGRSHTQKTLLRKDRCSALAPKQLIGLPWRVAFALQDDGWWLRSDIVWAKPACMPENVHDRPTKAHEYVFLLAKSRRYFYDATAISEKAVSTRTNGNRDGYHRPEQVKRGGRGNPNGRAVAPTRNKRSVWTVAAEPFPGSHFATFPSGLIRPCILAGSRPGDLVLDPFAGSGTTLMVAQQLGRRAVGIELNPDFAAMAAKRLTKPGMAFVEAAG